MILALLASLALAATPPVSPAPVSPASSASPAPDVDPNPTWVRTSLVVQVADVAAAQDALIARAEAAGGWFGSLTDDAVSLRVPVAREAEIQTYARSLGTLVDRSYTRQDLSDQLRTQRSGLAAREATLSRYFEVLRSANARSVVTVEREIDRLVQEIEGYKGQIRMLESRAAIAQVDVAFRFRDRRRPAPASLSSFDWINAVTLDDLLGSFRYGADERRVHGVDLAPPAGFAAYQPKHGARALTTDDVAWRVRVLRNKPKADLAFWREALARRLGETGYTPVAAGDATADGLPGAWSEWTAPDGERDATWLVALFVDGRRLVVVEAAGGTTPYAARRSAVLAALAAKAP